MHEKDHNNHAQDQELTIAGHMALLQGHIINPVTARNTRMTIRKMSLFFTEWKDSTNGLE
eukprot:9030048-Ditylum_brightwellii.AAC.1